MENWEEVESVVRTQDPSTLLHLQQALGRYSFFCCGRYLPHIFQQAENIDFISGKGTE